MWKGKAEGRCLGKRESPSSIEGAWSPEMQWFTETLEKVRETSSLLEPLEKEFSPADTLILPQGGSVLDF